ncbi:hypothetical protein [Sphingomonas segetis]|uniref:hypothetical protein n=1 Tax=Sphingomonas segetis TaxID=1104779 RepID=UPI0012D36159|nr:hypothetical protein [Sphingomonas segetis]
MEGGAEDESDIPNQKSLWDAYGHAMGAAAGLELAMRTALWDATRVRYADDEPMRERVAARISKLTFGGTASKFKAVFTGFGADPQFVAALKVATDLRNHFAHHFLEDRSDGLRSEEGIELLTYECNLAMEHFSDVEFFIRKFCPADFQRFFNAGQTKSRDWVDHHPLRKPFLAIRSGEIPSAEALKAWQREQMKKWIAPTA